MASAFKKIVQNKALADANVEGSDDDGVNVKAHMPIAREESGDESEKQDSAIDVNEEAPTLPNPEVSPHLCIKSYHSHDFRRN